MRAAINETSSVAIAGTYSATSFSDPFTTLGGGTTLVLPLASPGQPAVELTNVQMLVIEYQRRIFELSRQLEFYRRAIEEMVRGPDKLTLYSQELLMSTPLSGESVRLLNSVIAAPISFEADTSDEGDF